MPFKARFNIIKEKVKKSVPWLYVIIFQIPWYRLATFFLVVTIYFLRQDIRQMELENVELSRVNSEIIANQVSSVRILDKLRKPVWQKAKRGRKYTMQVLNKPFEKEFLKPYGFDKYDYYGQTDFAIFPYNAAKQFNKGDSLAAMQDEHVEYTEVFMDSKGNKITVDVMKWREITIDQDTLVWGMIR